MGKSELKLVEAFYFKSELVFGDTSNFSEKLETKQVNGRFEQILTSI